MNPIGPIAHQQVIAKINMVEKLNEAMQNRQQPLVDRMLSEKVQEQRREEMQRVQEPEEVDKKDVDEREGEGRDQGQQQRRKREQNAQSQDDASAENRSSGGHIDYLA